MARRPKSEKRTPPASMSAATRSKLAASVLAHLSTDGESDVELRCDNPLCMVGIKIMGVPGFAFVTSHVLQLPTGIRSMAWKVKSSPTGESFTISVVGATFDLPISGTTGPNSGGVRQLTV